MSKNYIWPSDCGVPLDLSKACHLGRTMGLGCSTLLVALIQYKPSLFAVRCCSTVVHSRMAITLGYIGNAPVGFRIQ